jgi:hypothetical protein|eukprot:COSAG06_NODE_1819_length_8293_cov_39.705394_13_plen_150_part_00
MLISSCSSQVREEYAHAISYLIAELKATGAKRHLSFGAILIHLCIKTRSFYQDRLGTSMGIGKQHSKKRATTFCAAAGLYIEMREEYRNMFLPERSSCKDMIEYDGACAKRKEKKRKQPLIVLSRRVLLLDHPLFEFFPMFAPSLSWQA